MADENGCVAYSFSDEPTYGYRPSLAAGIIFTILFTASTSAHVYQLVLTRTWWLTVFVIGGFGEILGWTARVAAFRCPYNVTLFQIQLACLIIAPNFFAAGFYVALSRLTGRLGRQHSPISPRIYLWVFCTCDLISLIVQSVGGGLANAAFNQEPSGNPKPGTNIMVGGIAFQLASILVFASFLLRVISSARTEVKEIREVKLIVIAISTSVLVMIIRGIYRTVELAQGWTGFLIHREGYFIGLDGVTMILALAVFNIYNPAILLHRPWSSSGKVPEVTPETYATEETGAEKRS